MKISKQARREAKELYRACVASGVLDENRVRDVVKRILQARPRGYLAMLSHFQRLIKLHLERRTARVESPVPLSDQQKSAIVSSLTNRYGQGLAFTYQQNPALIGGLRIRVGSDVYDGTIRARLAALEETF